MTTRHLFCLGILLTLASCAAGPSHDALVAENARLKRELAAKGQGQRGPAPIDRAEGRGGGNPKHEADPGKARSAAHQQEWRAFPVGDLSIPWGGEAKLGWLSARVREVKPCGKDRVGIELEIKNGSTEDLHYEPYGDAKLFDDAAVQKKTGFAFGEGGCERGHGRVKAGETLREWLVFEGTPREARLLELDLNEPSGLARYTLTFALAADVKAPAKKSTPLIEHGEPPPDRLGDSAETPFYRVSITGKKRCGSGRMPDGRAIVGIELTIENFSNVTFIAREGASLKDARGYEYTTGETTWDDGCKPRLSHARIAPGEKARGWLFPINVPEDAGALELRYQLEGEGGLFSSSDVTLALGALPGARGEATKPAVSSSWHPPADRDVARAGVLLTVTDVRVCSENAGADKRWVGVEVLVKNGSADTVVAGGNAQLADAEGYRYAGQNVTFEEGSGCDPVLHYETVKPGDKVRGWLYFFPVPTDAKGLALHYELGPRGKTSLDAHWEDVTLPIGELR